MTRHPEAVKAAADYMRLLAERSSREDFKAALTAHADALDAARDELIRLLGLTSALPPDLGNLHELPEEVLAELTVQKPDEIEDQLMTVLAAYGGTATLDQIIVGLWRRFKVAGKRRVLQGRLYKMPQVWAVPGRKSVYTTTEPEEKPKQLAKPEPEPVSGGYGGSASYSGGTDLDDDIPF